MHTEEQTYHLKNLHYFLRDPNSPFTVKEIALGARVPIIRAKHKETDMPCDISCRNGLSVENSRLIGYVVTFTNSLFYNVMFII